VAKNSVTVRVPAKVNLQLSVGPRESDGFHNLVSVFQAISIFDDVTVSKTKPGDGITISVTGEHVHGVPEDHTNLAVKAAQLVGSKFDFDVDVHIEVKKSIPVAGGMAGGSADAAATLVAMDALFDLEMSREELHSLGSELGSDVAELQLVKAMVINSLQRFLAAPITGSLHSPVLDFQLLPSIQSATVCVLS
jgi:4-diphosphocytidyl-2-C-methyl-D-erythritol kinase